MRIIENPTLSQKIELSKSQKLVKREINKDCRDYEERMVSEIIEENWSTRRLKRELSKGVKIMTGIKDKEGRLVTGREKIMETIAELYRKLYNSEEDILDNNLMDSLRQSEEETPPFTKAEIQKAIISMKIGKTPGPDNIENSFLKTFQEIITPPLAIIMNKVRRTGQTPIQWSIAEPRLLHKRGEKIDIENFRPISLTSNAGKIAMKVIKERMKNTIEENQSPEQAGFRSGFSTAEHILTMNQIIEKTREYNIEAHCIFIDLRKVFDSIKHHNYNLADS